MLRILLLKANAVLFKVNLCLPFKESFMVLLLANLAREPFLVSLPFIRGPILIKPLIQLVNLAITAVSKNHFNHIS